MQQDLPLLVWAYINHRQSTLGRHIERVPKRAMEALMAYTWPGNVRELENVIERALILSNGSTLRIDETLGASTVGGAAQLATERLDDVERGHIRRVLHECGWKVGGEGHAAERLGLHPNTLRSRMQKLGIRRPPGQ